MLAKLACFTWLGIGLGIGLELGVRVRVRDCFTVIAASPNSARAAGSVSPMVPGEG